MARAGSRVRTSYLKKNDKKHYFDKKNKKVNGLRVRF
jgi:hypothetical protein